MRKSAALLAICGLIPPIVLAAPVADPPIVANSMRTATDTPVCTALNCSSAAVPVVCESNMCSAAPVPSAPCENSMCRSDNAAPTNTGKG